VVLEFVFGFLLNYTPALSVFIFSIIILVVINIFYKILVNQNDAKMTKERTKEISRQIQAKINKIAIHTEFTEWALDLYKKENKKCPN